MAETKVKETRYIERGLFHRCACKTSCVALCLERNHPSNTINSILATCLLFWHVVLKIAARGPDAVFTVKGDLRNQRVTWPDLCQNTQTSICLRIVSLPPVDFKVGIDFTTGNMFHVSSRGLVKWKQIEFGGLNSSGCQDGGGGGCQKDPVQGLS